MNLNQLIYLRELVYTGNFTHAARNLGISQPALSTQITLLEEEVELALFDRSKKPVTLTLEGESFYEIASEILQRMDALKGLPFIISKKTEGTLRLGMIPTLAPYFVSLFMGELNRKHPDLELIIEELITREIVLKIRTGHLDAGIISTPVELSGRLSFQTLFYERFYLYVPERHPLFEKEKVSIEEIDQTEVWYLQEGNCFRNQVNSICSLAQRSPGKHKMVYCTNSIESLRRIVERRHGVTFIPELATMHLPPEQEEMIKPMYGTEPVREISMVSASFLSKRHLLDAFLDVALSQLPAHMKKKPSDQVVDTALELG
jgi:LysR family hydrogen peroxide-inducible transcriptional activator